MRCLFPLLLLCLPPAADAEHGGLAEFNQVTSRWYTLSRTPVLNEKVAVSLAPDDSLVLFTSESAGRVRELLKMIPPDGQPGLALAAGEDRYAQRRRVDFFRRHLGGPR